jgi:hypothetical protein
MKISDVHYSQDRQRYDLALRFIQHEARTSTIRKWTGLSDDRIRKLCQSYFVKQGPARLKRHRGKPPEQTAFFTRTTRMRQETDALASAYYLLGVLPASSRSSVAGDLPDVRLGEALCDAFESYRRLLDSPRISFEHAVFLLDALARGDELTPTRCSGCNGLIVIERYGMRSRLCHGCDATGARRLL